MWVQFPDGEACRNPPHKNEKSRKATIVKLYLFLSKDIVIFIGLVHEIGGIKPDNGNCLL
jgi:hypothetical protein